MDLVIVWRWKLLKICWMEKSWCNVIYLKALLLSYLYKKAIESWWEADCLLYEGAEAAQRHFPLAVAFQVHFGGCKLFGEKRSYDSINVSKVFHWIWIKKNGLVARQTNILDVCIVEIGWFKLSGVNVVVVLHVDPKNFTWPNPHKVAHIVAIVDIWSGRWSRNYRCWRETFDVIECSTFLPLF